MDIIVFIIICFTIFLLLSFCGACFKRRGNRGAVLSPPIIVTTQEHQIPQSTYPTQAVGPIYATNQPPIQQYPTQAAPYPMGMPMPQSNQQYPILNQGYQMPMPNTQPQGPYPASMPMPPAQQSNFNEYIPPTSPPSYQQAVGNESYQTQAPFNPHFKG